MQQSFTKNPLLIAFFATVALSACSTTPVNEAEELEQPALEIAKEAPEVYFKRIKSRAAQGNPQGQYQMGLWYEENHPNSPRDLVKAYVWYKLAANQDDYDSKYALERFEAQLTPSQRQQADAMINKWQLGDTLE
jgi:TPR repeat protein